MISSIKNRVKKLEIAKGFGGKRAHIIVCESGEDSEEKLIQYEKETFVGEDDLILIINTGVKGLYQKKIQGKKYLEDL